MRYGYARVSTIAQNLDRQIIELVGSNVNKKNIYSDKESGKDFNRTNYKRLMKKLRPGDVLFIKSIDRLGRNYSMILDEWHIITKTMEVDIVVLDMPLLDTRIKGKNLVGKFIADVVLQVLSFVSENERETMRQRQSEGIKAAKQRGVKFGRPSVPTPDNFQSIVNLYLNKKINSEEAINKTGLSRGTFYRKLSEYHCN
ncbi:MAG: recombinase family protein [Erysipelotrichaceae bacterium]|jgi:DNA invertase Pin-like site-specific DNA recombinase|nr:recombinase family protein [Erysipelotrichaceae bacterium]